MLTLTGYGLWRLFSSLLILCGTGCCQFYITYADEVTSLLSVTIIHNIGVWDLVSFLWLTSMVVRIVTSQPDGSGLQVPCVAFAFSSIVCMGYLHRREAICWLWRCECECEWLSVLYVNPGMTWRMDRCINGCMDEYMDRWMHGWMEGVHGVSWICVFFPRCHGLHPVFWWHILFGVPPPLILSSVLWLQQWPAGYHPEHHH